ncbi:MAG: hypothetical protein IPK19_24800 [Chloroflexi bacterium]|nr:hypothetical protein [Chloroflexota bacterium]
MNYVHFIERIRRAGWGDTFLTVLDVIEPVGIVGAQMLYVIQPVARLIGDRHGDVSALARLLETPEGVATLRQMLASDRSEVDGHQGDGRRDRDAGGNTLPPEATT